MLERLARLSIRVKLTATTLALVVLTVGLYGVMNLQDLRRVHDESREAQQVMVLENVATDTRNVMLALRSTASIFLSSSSYGDLEALVTEMRRQDPRLVHVRIVDEDGRAVLESGALDAVRVLDAAAARLGPGAATAAGRRRVCALA